VSIVAAALLVLAQGSPTVTIVGIGNRSCGAWTNAAQIRTVEATFERREFSGWLTGYLSGVNSTSELRGIASAEDAQGYLAWVDDYCAKHPLDTVYRAVASLVNELISRENG